MGRNPKLNVVNNEDFKERVQKIFELVADTIDNTLGPYGSTTILEEFGEAHITKDGWTVLKKIKFDDMMDNNILELIRRISAQVVIKVGDGSSSAIVTAEALMSKINDLELLTKTRPRDLDITLKKVVKTLCDIIEKNATKVTNMEEIYNLAYIATNGDDNIAKMIQDIYQKTGNPTIEFKQSKTADSYYDIINGYRAKIRYIDSIYKETDDGEVILKNPVILMFDHKIDTDPAYLEVINKAKQKAHDLNTRLVVIAPSYDQFFMDTLARDVKLELKATKMISTVYCTLPLINAELRTFYSDFSMFVGGTIIDQPWMIDMKECHYRMTHNTDENSERIVTPLELYGLDNICGSVGEMVITQSHTIIRDFIKMDEGLYQRTLSDARDKYNRLEEKHKELSIVDRSLLIHKQRITRLIGNMGIIYVGGNSSLESKALIDLVEDAVKACESAFSYGYNIGGNLTVARTAIKYFETLEDKSSLEASLVYSIYYAFSNTFKRILHKGIVDDEACNDIFNTCIDNEEDICYDLVNNEYSKKIINPCMTDIEILKASASIVSLLTISNQYIKILNPIN